MLERKMGCFGPLNKGRSGKQNWPGAQLVGKRGDNAR